jgi:pSer/pThr/pTyr-binding forkhead associated (FHA) protein
VEAARAGGEQALDLSAARVFACDVAFHLKVSKGAAAGEAYDFEDEARLGRTADNDVVVKDGAASRSHARIFTKGGKFFVEDLGSANGTRLNNAAVKSAKELKNGDAIMIGDTVFVFELNLDQTMAPSPSGTMDDSGDEAAEDPNMTRLPTRGSAGRKAAPPPRPDQTNAEADEPAEEDPPPDETGDTGSSTGEEDEGDSTAFVDVPKPKALASRPSRALGAAPRASGGGDRPSRGGGLERRTGGRAVVRDVEPDDEPVELTAAERARQRRQLQQSTGGRVQLLWQDLPKGARILLGFFGTILIVGTIGLAGYVAWPRHRTAKPEPKSFAADGTLVEDSFGEGNVTYRTPDQKAFTFAATSPTRIVGVLHYQAANISSDEVSINLNGQDLGTVPPDNIDVDSREVELILPAAVLKPRDENLVVFDNVKNPPGDEEWKIWNLWVEIIPVPEMSADEARRRAQGEIEKASKSRSEERRVGKECRRLCRSRWSPYH